MVRCRQVIRKHAVVFLMAVLTDLLVWQFLMDYLDDGRIRFVKYGVAFGGTNARLTLLVFSALALMLTVYSLVFLWRACIKR
jgi:hypothetical protein